MIRIEQPRRGGNLERSAQQDHAGAVLQDLLEQTQLYKEKDDWLFTPVSKFKASGGTPPLRPSRIMHNSIMIRLRPRGNDSGLVGWLRAPNGVKVQVLFDRLLALAEGRPPVPVEALPAPVTPYRSLFNRKKS